MPYHITESDGQFEVVSDTGKVMGRHPTRKQAVEQQRALYANVPDASAKEASDKPGDYLIVEDETKPTTWHLQVKKNGTPDHVLMGGAWAALHEGHRGNVYEGPGKGEAIKKLTALYKAEDLPLPGEATKKERRNILDTLLEVFRGVTTKEESLNQFQNRVYGSFNKKFSNPIPTGDPSIIGYVASPSIWIMDVYPNHVIVSYGDDYYSVPITDDGSTISFAMQPEWTKVQSKQEWIEKSTQLKEGRRNSTTDAERLQQIHDLSVMNGADCPMVFKEASGKWRWVMLSSNSYQDTDKEIIAQAALEADVERADKERNFGPLRWWHVGDPDPITRTPGMGIDIGDCDFNAMQGRILIESGTFRDDRIGEAIKEHADTLAGSIGFFHPLNQPDSEGVFTDIQRFERSLLPSAKASNQLVALAAIVKESQDMATMKEKFDEFVALLGGNTELAQSVVKQADATEKAAQAAGITSKAKDEKAKSDKPAKQGEEGSAEEEETEPKKEAEEEGDEPLTPKKFGEKVMPMVKKEIDDAIDAKLKEASRERTEKEAGLTAQIAALKIQNEALTAKLKEVEAVTKTLTGDLPRSVKDGYRASTAKDTLTNKEAENQAQPDPLSEWFGWVTTNLGGAPSGQAVQPPTQPGA